MIQHICGLNQTRKRPLLPVNSLIGAIATIPFVGVGLAMAIPVNADSGITADSPSQSFSTSTLFKLNALSHESNIPVLEPSTIDQFDVVELAQAAESETPDSRSPDVNDGQNTASPPTAESLNLDPDLVEDSPVFQRWLDEIPDVAADIRRDPSFRTRLRFGYAELLSTDEGSGFLLAIEDVFVGDTHLTLAADYQATFEGDRQSYGAEARYYLAPLGGYVNLAPVVGYRSLETDDDRFDGLNLGLRLVIVPSRTGAADLAVSQRWINPGRDRHEVSLTSLSLGYAVTRNWRLSSEFQWQKTPDEGRTRLGVTLEWML
jgi:hypothetical protein